MSVWMVTTLAASVTTFLALRRAVSARLLAVALIETNSGLRSQIGLLKRIVAGHSCPPDGFGDTGEVRFCEVCGTTWEAGELVINWDEENIFGSTAAVPWRIAVGPR
jgi:hypothetical protein